MRRLLLFIIPFLFAFASKSQVYGNEWINFSQKYFKLPVFKEGLYRIDSTDLSKYYDLTNTDPHNFQLFLKGKEQFLYIHGEGDGKINTGDYIEFYASPFMGDVDSLIYTNIKYVPNPYLPLYNDTIYAFLTLNTSTSNKRYIQETDVNFSAYQPVDYFYTEKVFFTSSTYNQVTEFSSGSADAHLTQAEGYGSYVPRSGSSPGSAYTFPVSNLNVYTVSALPFYISTNYSGQSQAATYSPDHNIQLFYSDQNNAQVLLSDTTFYGYQPVRKKFVLNSQNTNNNSTVTFSSVTAPTFTANGTENWHYLHYYYPHTTDLNFAPLVKMTVEDHQSSSKSYFDFSNFGVGTSTNVILYDITNGKRIPTVINFLQVKAIIPNGSGKKMCVMVSEKDTIVVRKLIPVNQTGSFIDYKNLTANKPYVMIYHKSLQPSAMTYKSYRESVAGGGYNVVDADIQTLYEQFSYGVNKHPISIRNFIRFLKDNLPQTPQYVLIIGKAMSFSELLQPSTNRNLNLVPTIGIPASDVLLTASLSSTNTNAYYPEIPIGRLAVYSNTEVTNYLAKVQTHEQTTQVSDWKKQVLHFVGGDDDQLLSEISTYMDGFKEIITDTLFGGNVVTVKKNTTAPVQNNISDSLRNVINRGAGLINFFGHGSSSGFDQAVDDPEMYNNKDKYPFVIANSCYSGDIHLFTGRSVSERFVITPQKGSIGFLATTSYGFPWNLNNFTRGFYRALSQTHYNQGIGNVIKEASLKNADGNILNNLISIDMTLSGDPAVRISNGLLPDYQIANPDISFDLKKYTDSVGVRINYKNLGMARRDTIAIKMERFFPNGDSVTITKFVKPVMYKDSFSYYFPLDFNRGIGLNKFRVKLDHYERVTEVSETNNTIGPIDFFIPGGDILPVYPYKYAVIPVTQTLTLKASTTDPFAPSTTYRFQLDTCDSFTSLISTTLITSTGGVVEWKVNLPYGDSTVYFWRVSRDSISPLKAFAWRESSFQTIGNKRGWSQAHFHQFKNDAYQFVNYKKDKRQFVFENDKHSIQCRTAHYPALKEYELYFYYDTEKLEEWPSAFDGWNFAVFDSIGGKPKQMFSPNTPATGLGPFNNCIEHGNRYVYSFGNWSACGSPPTWKADMENFLNSIPVNNYVLAYTTGKNRNATPAYCQVSSYSNSLYTAFESIGAKNIRTTADSVPYILFGRKGMSAGQGHTTIGVNSKSIIYQEDSVKTRWNSGYVASEIIGPSFGWNSLHWRVKSLDNNSADKTLLKVVGIKKNGLIDTLASFKEDSLDIMALSNYADASVYPYLKLVAFMNDDLNRTSPQLERWQVLYDEAPECAINPLKGFASINDTLLEGDEVTFRFPIENVGYKDFNDSLVVTYWVENKDLLKIPLPHKLKAAPFLSGQVLIDTVKVNTYQLNGSNALWIFVNPINDPNYQREQSQFNNIGRYAFTVNKDVTNPLLDVTFDGVRILNGDIISARPNILITLKDENKFLALNDTSAFTIYLMTPNQSQQQRIYFGEQLQFTPANLPKNSCSINYNPTFAMDGKYTFIVQAKDRSRNASAARDYRVEFEVYTKPSVTHVLNYPNPFSTSTRFVFTLTGSEIPEVFTIQIMTITGKIVREITRSELGNIHIGRNITDYAWDGRDNYGDRLANGVYLYRVITKLNGENVEKNSSGADKFFIKDFGKMVLMR